MKKREREEITERGSDKIVIQKEGQRQRDNRKRERRSQIQRVK